LAFPFRKRSTFHWPITLSAALMTMNIALMVVWIVFFAKFDQLTALTIGTIAFSLILVGLSFYLFLTIKEIRLNRRQANFVDSVTHELKSPIASLRLYLETLQMRSLEAPQRAKFYATMESELKRLDALISQLLEVGRLDAIGHETEPEDLVLEPLLRRCAATACAQSMSKCA
jgi:signal transduction histidine kinase